MPYPFAWKPNYVTVILPAQVTVFDTGGNLALMDTGVSITPDGTINFSVVNYGKYTVKVRENLALELSTFTTKNTGISVPEFTMYEAINNDGVVFFSNYIKLPDLDDPESEARLKLDTLYSGVGSGTAMPAGGTAFQFVRKNTTNTGFEWLTLTKDLVGLSNVDNTADADKPISDQTVIALGTKAETVHQHSSSQISDATTTGKSILTATTPQAVKDILGTDVSLDDLPAGTNLIVAKTAGIWPSRPTTRADIVVTWIGPLSDPPIVSTPATNGMYENDIRMVTSV